VQGPDLYKPVLNVAYVGVLGVTLFIYTIGGGSSQLDSLGQAAPYSLVQVLIESAKGFN
jgi:hypothetical protein